MSDPCACRFDEDDEQVKWCAVHLNLRDRLAALRNAAEESIRDARRLAHLERMFRVMSPNIDGNHVWTFTNIPTLRGPNLRAAIDAAIAQEQT